MEPQSLIMIKQHQTFEYPLKMKEAQLVKKKVLRIHIIILISMMGCVCEKLQDVWLVGLALSIGLVSWLLLFYIALQSVIISTVSAAFVSIFSFLLMRHYSRKPQIKSMTYSEALVIFECEHHPSKKAIEWTYKCKAKLYNEYKNFDFYKIRLERLEEAKIILLRHLET